MLSLRSAVVRRSASCLQRSARSRRYNLGALSSTCSNQSVASVLHEEEENKKQQLRSLPPAGATARIGSHLFRNAESWQPRWQTRDDWRYASIDIPVTTSYLPLPSSPRTSQHPVSCFDSKCQTLDCFVAHTQQTLMTRLSLYRPCHQHASYHSSVFERTMHNVVFRATFSTQAQTQEQQEEEQAEQTTGKAQSLSHEEPKSGGSGSSSSSSSSRTSSSAALPEQQQVDKRSAVEKVKDGIASATKAILNFFIKLPGVLWFYLTHPMAFRDKLVELKEAAKKEAQHYWMGTKLLYADLRTARKMLGRTLQGSPLTRRERKQLLRTVSDLFRLVPMSMFVLIPFMEFALPFALKLFPNMLPSTFQDSLKAEENMKRELQMRIAMAQFFQETLSDLAKEQKKQAEQRLMKERSRVDGDGGDDGGEETASEVDLLASKQEESASSMIEFLEKARKGEMIPPEVIIKFATHFHDDLTLDNMPRMQLINMCKYMSIPPYGADSFLRFQLRNRIRTLKEDDQRILWEGIDSLTKMELREACRERGMRSTGLSKEAYKKALQQWLELSVNQKVPISLLIMSRTFFLREEMTGYRAADHDGSKSVAGLADAISGLDKEVVNEVVLEVATAKEKQSDPEVMKLKLEVLEKQNELILEEQKEREVAAKKKELKEKEKEQAEASEDKTSQTKEQSATEVADAEQELKDVIELTKDVKELEESLEKTEELLDTEIKSEEEEETELSSGELEAISQLVSPDPVRNEREELQRIRDAIASGDNEESVEKGVSDAQVEEIVDAVIDPLTSAEVSEDADKVAAKIFEEMDAKVDKEAKDSTAFGADGEVVPAADSVETKESEDDGYVEDKRLDQAIKGLKSKVESMVGKIEVQLSDIEVKIGDKLHILDKDMDGILTREEMANALQQVLKRQLTAEEAMVIAAHMDENEDGLLTVAELARWLETNKIVKLVEEGRDADVDRIIAKQVESSKEETEEQQGETSERTK